MIFAKLTAAPLRQPPCVSAIAYAEILDALLAEFDAHSPLSDADSTLYETLVDQVGALLGGLGAGGFAVDVNLRFDAISDEFEGDPEYAPYAGGWVKTGLYFETPEAEDAMEAAAVAWEEGARRIVAAALAVYGVAAEREAA